MIKTFSFAGLIATLLFGPAQPMSADLSLDMAKLTPTPATANRDSAVRFHTLAVELASVR